MLDTKIRYGREDRDDVPALGCEVVSNCATPNSVGHANEESFLLQFLQAHCQDPRRQAGAVSQHVTKADMLMKSNVSQQQQRPLPPKDPETRVDGAGFRLHGRNRETPWGEDEFVRHQHHYHPIPFRAYILLIQCSLGAAKRNPKEAGRWEKRSRS